MECFGEHCMLAFQWECVDSELKKIQGIFQTIMLGSLHFKKKYFPDTKKEIYSRNAMFDFPLIMEAISTYSCSFMNDKYQT